MSIRCGSVPTGKTLPRRTRQNEKSGRKPCWACNRFVTGGDNAMNDFRYALRSLRRSPGLTLAAITSLALGIGANTAIFSVANAVILRSMPVEKPEELALVRYSSK